MRVEGAPPQPGDEENGILRVNLIMAPKDVAALHVGKTAAELRAMGFKVGEDVPDFAELRADATFEWIELDFTLTPDGAEFDE